MDAHFQRPTAEQKNRILRLAPEQISAGEQLKAPPALRGDGTSSLG